MIPDPDAPASSASDPAQVRSLVEDLRSLLTDSKTLAQAELEFQKKRAVHAGRSAPVIVGLLALAAALAFFALMALVFGSVLAIAATLGPVAATAIVVGVLLVAVMAALLLASARWKRLRADLKDRRS